MRHTRQWFILLTLILAVGCGKQQAPQGEEKPAEQAVKAEATKAEGEQAKAAAEAPAVVAEA